MKDTNNVMLNYTEPNSKLSDNEQKTYRFTLDQRSGYEFWHICPNCGNKTLKRYVDIENNYAYLSDEVGWCSRKNDCRYNYSPKLFFSEHPLNYNIEDERSRIKRLLNQNFFESSTHTCVEDGVVEYRMLGKAWQNNFTRWLTRLIVPELGKEALSSTIKRYQLGSDIKNVGAVIFWRRSINNEIRTGKIILCDETTGKISKSSTMPKIDWVHSRLLKEGRLPHNFELKQCLFGEHLLSSNPDADVFVFGSERSAVIASLCFPDKICIASGGQSDLTAGKFKVLEGRNIMFFPDFDTIEWKNKIEEIAKSVNFNSWKINDSLSMSITTHARSIGFDQGDHLIKEIIKTKPISF